MNGQMAGPMKAFVTIYPVVQAVEHFAKTQINWGSNYFSPSFAHCTTGSTISTLFYDTINPKDCQALSLGDSGFLQFFRVVSSDYGKPRTRRPY